MPVHKWKIKKPRKRAIRIYKKPSRIIKKDKKINRAVIVETFNTKFISKLTYHSLKRFMARVEGYDMYQLTEDILNHLDTLCYCKYHSDLRIIGSLFVYHFDSAYWKLITLYKNDPAAREHKRKYHKWLHCDIDKIKVIFE